MLNYEATGRKIIVCHNNSDVYHYFRVEAGRTVTTGQPYLDVLDTDEEVIAQFGDIIPEIYLE